MHSPRNAVIALLASGALVLVLAGVSAGVFTIHDPSPLVGQSVSVHQDAGPGHAVPLPPDIAAPAAPAVPAPAAPAPAAPAVPAPAVLVHHAIAAPTPSQPVTHFRQVQMPEQPHPAPAPNFPAPVAPAPDHRPVSAPPSSAYPGRDAKSRTVNTEPCACDGTMRKVPTHWEPPTTP